ncbi:adenylate cyclase [Acrasis kona]|uniref:Adenylate cyclase n=1 Tax=Acrasis kona TaxID=1008807 RepID=A0AAW2ZAS0_9EUKA
MWNDSYIQSLNPALVLPAKPITVVVRQDSSGTTDIFTSALSTFDSKWASTVGRSQLPLWPTRNTSLFMTAPQSIGMSKAVLLSPYSIGYNTYSLTINIQQSFASFKNSQGIIVLPTLVGITSALSQAINFMQSNFETDLTLVDEATWPISGVSYMMFKARNMTDCDQALALYKYMSWILSVSETSADVMISTLQFASLPKAIKAKIQSAIDVNFYCQGAPVISLLPKNDQELVIALTSTGSIALAVVLIVILIIVAVLVLIIMRLKRQVNFIDEGPTGKICIMFTDVQNSTFTWKTCGQNMATAIAIHNKIIRNCILRHDGYEVKNLGDSFMVVFSDHLKAVRCANDIQLSLLHGAWPEDVLKIDTASELIDEFGCLLFRGLRVRIGIAVGDPTPVLDTVTRRTDYFGDCINLSSRIESVCEGGLSYMSSEVRDLLSSEPGLLPEKLLIRPAGIYSLQGIPDPQELFLLLPNELEARHGRTIPNTKKESLMIAQGDTMNAMSASSTRVQSKYVQDEYKHLEV